MPTQEIQIFLDEISQAMQELRDEKKRTARRLAPDFSVFDMTRSDEMALSKCFAGLLNPEGGHGQGRLFLDKFLEKICGKPEWATGKTCTVELEKEIKEKRRIDIYLDFGSTGVIGIENKPWAGDQKDQLSDYAKDLASYKKSWLLLYFCNGEPSKESIKPDELEKIKESGNFIHIKYDQVIAWLDECLSETCSIKVQIFIEDLIQFIRLKINQELTVAETNKIVEIIKDDDKKIEAAFDIYKSMDDLKDTLLKKLEKDLKEKSKYKYEFEFDNLNNKQWLTKKDKGCITIYGEISDICLFFEFESKNLDNLAFGIYLEGGRKGINNENEWNRLTKCLEDLYGEKIEEDDNCPWYASINQSKLFEKDIENWSNNPIPWQMIQSGEMAKRMLELADEVYALLEKNCPEARI